MPRRSRARAIRSPSSAGGWRLPKSSVHLILRTLERRGYLQKQSVGGRYKFGMKLIALSRTALDGVELRDEARPALAALAQRTALTVHMGVLERSEIVIIERLESASPIRVVSWIGRRMDLNSTAVGKALIAYLPDDGVRGAGPSEPACAPQRPHHRIDGGAAEGARARAAARLRGVRRGGRDRRAVRRRADPERARPRHRRHQRGRHDAADSAGAGRRARPGGQGGGAEIGARFQRASA